MSTFDTFVTLSLTLFLKGFSKMCIDDFCTAVVSGFSFCLDQISESEAVRSPENLPSNLMVRR